MNHHRNNSNLSQSTFKAGMLQSQAYRALTVFMTSHLETYGLSLPEWSFLGVLTETLEMRPTEIANALGVKQPNVTRIAISLRSKGLVSTTTHPEDNRGSYTALTNKGRTLTNMIEHALRKEMRGFLADIDRHDLEIYLRVLAQIADKG